MPKAPPKVIRVLARGEGQVMDYAAKSQGHGQAPHRRITHHHDPELGPQFIDVDGNLRRHGAWVKRVADPHVIPLEDPRRQPLPKDEVGWPIILGSYLRDIKNGDLFPADDESAAVVGLPFTLAGAQLKGELERGAIPHRWLDVAKRAVEAKRSFMEELAVERDGEHGEEALAAHKADHAELKAFWGLPAEPQQPTIEGATPKRVS